MNDIPVRQNELIHLQRLSAQRELYSYAKRVYKVQLWGSTIIPIALSFIALFVHGWDVYAATYGIVFLVFDTTLLSPIIPKVKRKAASIQELFDCDVLQISKSPLKSASDVTVEEVLTHYDAYSKVQSNVEKVRDWYPKEVGDVNISSARLICQRTNCWWDSRLRSKYCKFVKGFGIAVPLLLVMIGVVRNLQFGSIVLIASAIIPYFQFSIKEHNDNMDACERLDRLHAFILTTWERVLRKDISHEELLNLSRIIQDDIYDHRAKSPLILDGLYNKSRSKDESLMSKTANILVGEVRQSNADL